MSRERLTKHGGLGLLAILCAGAFVWGVFLEINVWREQTALRQQENKIIQHLLLTRSEHIGAWSLAIKSIVPVSCDATAPPEAIRRSTPREDAIGNLATAASSLSQRQAREVCAAAGAIGASEGSRVPTPSTFERQGAVSAAASTP
jgi:hypothetical protein